MPECSSKSLRLDESGRGNSVPSGLEALLFAAESLSRVCDFRLKKLVQGIKLKHFFQTESNTKPESDPLFSMQSDSAPQANAQPAPNLWKKIYCVEGERLKELFRFCPRCGSRQEDGESSVHISAVGSAPVVTVRCKNCSRSPNAEVIWTGQSKAVDHSKARAFGNNIRVATVAATSGVRISVSFR